MSILNIHVLTEEKPEEDEKDFDEILEEVRSNLDNRFIKILIEDSMA